MSGRDDDLGGLFAVVSTYARDMRERARKPVVRVGGRRVRGDRKLLALVEEAARAEDERAPRPNEQPSANREPVPELRKDNPATITRADQSRNQFLNWSRVPATWKALGIVAAFLAGVALAYLRRGW